MNNGSQMLFIENNSEEWNYMWSELAKHDYNKDNKEPTVCSNNYECWQYMGTSVSNEEFKHEFRHRMHPDLNDRRIYIRITVSDNFNPKTS